MTRMKHYWDEIRPEYSFLTSKLLRNQASRVVKNKVVMATQNLIIMRQLKTDLYKTLNDVFILKINEYSIVDVGNRPYLTSINKKPSVEELKTINFIATKYINSPKYNGGITLNIIDNVIYKAAIAIRTQLSDLSEKKYRRETPKQPKWLTNLEQKVTKLRKMIAHISVVLEYKRSNDFTRHQLKVRENLH